MLSDLGLVPVWAALVFIVRGVIVDAIRYAAISTGETAFGMMKSPAGRFLVASRFVRALYGTVKALTFGWVLLIQPWPVLYPAIWPAYGQAIGLVTSILVYASVFICLLRAFPVVYEFIERERPFALDHRKPPHGHLRP